MANPPGELNPLERAEEHILHRREIADLQDQLIGLDKREVDGIVTGLQDRTPVSLHGVDTSVIKDVDPGFDAEAFRAIARETFEKVREARALQTPRESAELLSPQMQREMQDTIAGDVASHRHHLLPLLWLRDAVIAKAEVVGGLAEIGVRFSISAAEVDVDDSTRVVTGDDTEQSWDELWQFMRNPEADTSVNDERHQITLIQADQWLVAHRGWMVTGITRLPA